MKFRHKKGREIALQIYFLLAFMVSGRGSTDGDLDNSVAPNFNQIIIKISRRTKLTDVLSSSPIWETFWECRHLEQWFHFSALSEWLIPQDSAWILISKQLLVWTWTVHCGAERLFCLQIRHILIFIWYLLQQIPRYIDIYLSLFFASKIIWKKPQHLIFY